MNKVEISGVNTAKLPLLTSEEKTALMTKIKQGDEAARQEFINGNLRLVLSIIRRFGGRGENADDLFQVGCIGLIKAIDNFDLSQNVQFSTYAVPMIIGEIRRYLRDNSSVRVSRSLRDIAYKALQAKEELSKNSFDEPSIEDVAKMIGEPLNNVTFALDAISDTISLSDPVYTDGSDTIHLLDQIADTKHTDENIFENLSIKDAIKSLSDREREILMMRYYIGKTQTEVSDEIGISQAQVSRLEKNALKVIKEFLV